MVFSVGNNACTLIQPQEFQSIVTFCLGQFAEVGSEHYVTLDQNYFKVVNIDIPTDNLVQLTSTQQPVTLIMTTQLFKT